MYKFLNVKKKKTWKKLDTKKASLIQNNGSLYTTLNLVVTTKKVKRDKRAKSAREKNVTHSVDDSVEFLVKKTMEDLWIKTSLYCPNCSLDL